MNKRLLILLILCLIEAFIIGYLAKQPKTPPNVPVKEIIRDSIIRDSIIIVNEKIKKEIVYIEKQANKDSSAIMSANDSILLSKFSRYIEDYNNK
jgi:hypothetical protein